MTLFAEMVHFYDQKKNKILAEDLRLALVTFWNMLGVTCSLENNSN